MAPREGDNISRLPFLKTWFRTRSAIVLHLSNGILQVSLFWHGSQIHPQLSGAGQQAGLSPRS